VMDDMLPRGLPFCNISAVDVWLVFGSGA
jgi:hypothetical protein